MFYTHIFIDVQLPLIAVWGSKFLKSQVNNRSVVRVLNLY